MGQEVQTANATNSAQQNQNDASLKFPSLEERGRNVSALVGAVDKGREETASRLDSAQAKDKGVLAEQVGTLELDKSYWQLLKGLFDGAAASQFPDVAMNLRKWGEALLSLGVTSDSKASIGMGDYVASVRKTLQKDNAKFKADVEAAQKSADAQEGSLQRMKDNDIEKLGLTRLAVAEDPSILSKGKDAVIDGAMQKYAERNGFLDPNIDVVGYTVELNKGKSFSVKGGKELSGYDNWGWRNTPSSIKETATKDIKYAIEKGVFSYNEAAKCWRMNDQESLSKILEASKGNPGEFERLSQTIEVAQKAWGKAFGQGAIEAKNDKGEVYPKKEGEGKLIEALYEMTKGGLEGLVAERKQKLRNDIITRLTRTDSPLIQRQDKKLVVASNEQIKALWQKKIDEAGDDKAQKKYYQDERQKELHIAGQITNLGLVGMDVNEIAGKLLPDYLKEANSIELKTAYERIKTSVEGENIVKTEQGSSQLSIVSPENVEKYYCDLIKQETDKLTQVVNQTGARLCENQLRAYLFDQWVAGHEGQLSMAQAEMKKGNFGVAAKAYYDTYQEIKKEGDAIAKLDAGAVFNEIRNNSPLATVLDRYIKRDPAVPPQGNEMFIDEAKAYMSAGETGDLLMHFARYSDKKEFLAHIPNDIYGQPSTEINVVHAALQYALAEKPDLFLDNKAGDVKPVSKRQQEVFNALQTGSLDSYIKNQAESMSANVRYQQVIEDRNPQSPLSPDWRFNSKKEPKEQEAGTLEARDTVRSIVGDRGTLDPKQQLMQDAFARVAMVPTAEQWDNLGRSQFRADEKIRNVRGCLNDNEIENYLAAGAQGELILHKFLYGDPNNSTMPLFRQASNGQKIVNPDWDNFLKTLRMAIADESMSTLFKHGYGPDKGEEAVMARFRNEIDADYIVQLDSDGYVVKDQSGHDKMVPNPYGPNPELWDPKDRGHKGYNASDSASEYIKIRK